MQLFYEFMLQLVISAGVFGSVFFVVNSRKGNNGDK